MGKQGFGSNLGDIYIPTLTPLQQFIKEKTGKTVSKDELAKKVYIDGVPYDSPEINFSSKRPFREWVGAKCNYANEQSITVSHLANLVRKYSGKFGWIEYEVDTRPLEIVIPQESILDYE